MSRIITMQTSITDKELAIQAIKQAGISYREMGETRIQFTSGHMANATLDLTTGSISGDSDFGHTKSKFGLLRQFYAEAEVRREYQKNGATIDERTTDKEGNIVLTWHMA